MEDFVLLVLVLTIVLLAKLEPSCFMGPVQTVLPHARPAKTTWDAQPVLQETISWEETVVHALMDSILMVSNVLNVVLAAVPVMDFMLVLNVLLVTS